MVDNHPLRKYRLEKGLTQEAFGKELGVTDVTISRWETGRRKVGGVLLPMIAEKTGISPSALRPDLADLLNPEPQQAAE